MAKSDYYDLLGVSKGASDDDIKKAYRKQAMQYHPDRNQGDPKAEQKFKEISEAYEILKDPQKRSAYDQYGHSAFEQGGGRPGGGFHPGAEGFEFNFGGSFSDVFEEIFNGGRRAPETNSRGSDLRYDTEITLEEAFQGVTKTIKVATLKSCGDCKGSGGQDGAKPKTCPHCQGRGKIRAQQGFFTIERPCSSCDSMGQVIDKPCKTCKGHGRVRGEKTLTVNIPKGVDEGSRIRLTGEGEAGLRGGPTGDLYAFIHIKPHTFFERDGSALYCRVPVSMTTAALGHQIDVPTIDGTKARISIPEGAQSGKQLRLKGKGMTALRSNSRGDMYIQVLVETPQNLSKKQRELLEEFEKASEKTKSSPEADGFFQKMKDLFGG